MTMHQSIRSLALTLCSLGAVTLGTMAEAAPLRSSQLYQSPQSHYEQVQFRQPQLQFQAADFDYQVFAPSAPTSGPLGIWRYGTCNNTVRVLVSNIGEDTGTQMGVTLTVTESNGNRVRYNRTVNRRGIAAGQHIWVEFTDVRFPNAGSYQLTSGVSASGDASASNNTRSLSAFVNHACN